MKMKRTLIISSLVLGLIFGFSLSSQATLLDMNDGTIYDTDRQLSWLKDGNYAMTSGVDADGLMTWSEALSWADTLVFAGFDNWRPPTALNQDGSGPCGPAYSCTGSEMGHLYYEEGIRVGSSGDFINLQDGYWSGTAYGANGAWISGFQSGYQNVWNKNDYWWAWAVSPGERSTPVPEPGTLLLLGAGLAAMAVLRKQFTA